ncbi:MAG: 8-oxo-dGTP diphosphatase MutT [Pseudomonadota bacterium]
MVHASPVVAVVAGVLIRDRAVLIAQRKAQQHGEGLWEFPGGKIQHGEAALIALRRELDEELGIEIRDASPLIEISHDYADRHVQLRFFRVREWTGEAHGREGQVVRWCAIEDLSVVKFLPANGPVVALLQEKDEQPR